MFFVSVSLLFLLEKETELKTGAFFDSEQIVLIDAGHGGEDGGAVGIGGILEKEINLSVSEKLEKVLNLCGINTDMTRRNDEALYSDSEETTRKRKIADIKERVKKVERTPGATLISIHQNSFPQNDCKGAQVFFSESNIKSKELAESVQLSLKDGLGGENRRKAKTSDRTIYLLNNVRCPAVLIECGFLTNQNEVELLSKDMYQTKLAVCIAAGFLKYKG